jgi:hypothetical protein
MSSIIRSAMFLALTALAALPGEAYGRVGVTSATDGDPLGRPPAAAERVLRVGVDIEANEHVTTQAGDRAHVVFLDGTSITLGPNSALTIDKFVFDPSTARGDMGVTLTKGVLRFVGGKISKNSEVTITTLSATIGIRGGIAAVAVGQDGNTKADFLFGDRMRMTSQGVTQAAVRPGTRIEADMHRPPSAPVMLPPGAMAALTKSLEKPVAAPITGTPSAPSGVSASITHAFANSKSLISTAPRDYKHLAFAAKAGHISPIIRFSKPAKTSVHHIVSHSATSLRRTVVRHN